MGTGAGVPLGSGSEHEAFLVDGRFVVRRHLHPDPAVRRDGVVRESALLRALPDLVPVPTPRVVSVDAEAGQLVLTHLPGRALADLLDERPGPEAVGPEAVGAEMVGAEAVGAEAVGAEMVGPGVMAPVGRLLAALAGASDVLAPLLGVDAHDPADALAEAVEDWAAVRQLVPPQQHGRVQAHLAAVPPPAAGRLVACHGDLGAEHLLVDDAAALTGVIDWSDAALTDPARDLGRLLRDLGPRAVAPLLAGPPDDPGLPARAVSFARSTLLEDLAWGHREGRPRYVRAALRRLPETFDDDLLDATTG